MGISANIDMPTKPLPARRDVSKRADRGGDVPLYSSHQHATESQELPPTCADQLPSSPRLPSRCYCSRIIDESGLYAIYLTVIAVAGPALFSITQDGSTIKAGSTDAASIMLFLALVVSFLGLRAAREEDSMNSKVAGDIEYGRLSNDRQVALRSCETENRPMRPFVPLVLGHISIFLLLGSMLVSMPLALGSAAALISIFIFIILFYVAPTG